MNIQDKLKDLFQRWCGEPCRNITPIGANGSGRQYFRMEGAGHGCMAAYNSDIKENRAFLYYSGVMRSHGIHVPEIYAVGDDGDIYLQQDLGDTTLYRLLQKKKEEGHPFDEQVVGIYRTVLSDLSDIQVKCRDMQFEQYAFPRADFDLTAIMWDLNYFKYNFLKLVGIGFDEELLQRDFDALCDVLTEADCSYFLYRDFQARNIMLVLDKDGAMVPYYIDYQGGRRGAPHYDVASLLYSAKSGMPEKLRDELLEYYIDALVENTASSEHPMTRERFMRHWYPYVLVRILQTLGAYGYRGLFERKSYFLQSIPIAVSNLKHLLDTRAMPAGLDYISHLADVLADSVTPRKDETSGAAGNENRCLTVDVYSFSFKGQHPVDASGNGGGFVFDCRALPNPGRYPQYKQYTGRDYPVIEFLSREPSVDEFLDKAEALVSQAVENYLARGFSHLSVAFGCTGGQHRSVYCAESLSRRIAQRFPACKVQTTHMAH